MLRTIEPRSRDAPEQGSEVLALICRNETSDPGSTVKAPAEIIVAKHRNGPTAKIRLAFLEHLSKFANMTRQ